jgi:hypothetical protein
MERSGFVVDHAPAHRDGVVEDFISKAELLESVDTAGGKGEINRAAANSAARSRVGPAFVEINLNAAPAEEGGEQASRKATTDKSKLWHDQE